MNRPFLLATSLALVLTASCAEEPVPEAPPLFSAYDPTVQCGAGEVGWDLSTGGGLDPLQRNSVGDVIKLINSNLTNCGLTGTDLRQACDGETECTKAVTCADSAVDVTYVCGTEAATYTARVEGVGADRFLRISCGMPITVLKAFYAPNATRPADISSALAARCSGKRRCSNGASGYSLNSFVDPAPNQPKTVKVTYRCGIEPAERIAEVDDFTLDFYCPLNATKFPVRENIKVVSAEPRLEPYSGHQDNLAWAAELKEQIAKACDGKPQCEVSFTGLRANGSDPKGSWAAVRDINRNWILKGTDAMGWPDERRLSTGGSTLIGGNYLILGYTCGAGNYVNYKAIDPTAAPPNERVTIRCGDFVTVTGLDTKRYGERTFSPNPIMLAATKARCDGRRVCTPPAYFGRSGPGSYTGPDGGQQAIGEYGRFRYTCGDLTNSVSVEKEIDYYGAINPADLECPPAAGDLLATGVQLVSVTPESRTLEVSRLCGGRTVCSAPAGVTATYRCADDPAVKTSSPEMNCGTLVFPTGVTSSAYACFETPGPSACANQRGTCKFFPRYASDYGRATCGNVTYSYTCGCDPTVRTKTYTPRPDGLPVFHNNLSMPVELTCPPVATSCTRKGCVPLRCTGATRRNADLACVPDSSLKPTHFLAMPAVNDWVSLPDGGTDPLGRTLTRAADGAFVIKSDFPYQVFSSVLYKSDNGQVLDDKTTALAWSFDQFKRKAGATRPDGGVLPELAGGMRCVVNQAALRGSERTSTIPGYRWALVGGKGQTIPSNCFEQDGYNDPSTSVYDAAAALGLEESQFRARYDYFKTFMTSSLDPQGVSVVRRLTPTATPVGVNPIGFFYDPRRDFVSLTGFYAQTTDFANSVQVRFEQSTQIELGALFETVSAGDLLVDVEQPNLLPSFDVSLGWYLRGDSQANPYSARTRVANNPAGTSLASRNLRMTVEMARSDTGLANPWVESNSVRFPAGALAGGSNFLQTDTMRVEVTPALRKRLLSVRSAPNSLAAVTEPDGFMADLLDEDTSFLVRTCIDMDGMTRAPADTGIDNATLPTLNGYSLKVVERCTPPRTVVFTRQLFVRPTTPAAAAELKNDKGAGQSTGDRDLGGSNTNGSEVSCIRECGTNADCGVNGTCNLPQGARIGTCAKTLTNRTCKDATQSKGGLGGQLPISMFDSKSDSSSEINEKRAGAQTTNCANGRGAMLSFTVLEPTGSCQDRLDAPTWEVKLELIPNFEPVIAFFKGKKYGVFNTDAKKTLMRAKNFSVRRSARGTSASGKKESLWAPQSNGLGFAASREFYITIGPIPIVVEVGFSAGFGIKGVFTFKGQTAEEGMTSQFYPCVNGSAASTGTCYEVDSEPKTFEDALKGCQERGGSLAVAKTSTLLSAVNLALDRADGGTLDGGPSFWIGAQAAYNYEYPSCSTNGVFKDGGVGPNGTFSESCRTASATSYEWLEGGGSIAKQRGLSPAIVPSPAVTISNPFTNLSLGPSLIPARAGLSYQRSGAVKQAPTEELKPSICSFDGASQVKSTTNVKEFNIEFSIGVALAICVPSNRVGICIAGDLTFFSASWAFASSQTETNVFQGPSNNRVQKSLFGSTDNTGEWTRSLISGSIGAELRAFFFTKRFVIKEFKPVKQWEGDIYQPSSSPYFRRFP